MNYKFCTCLKKESAYSMYRHVVRLIRTCTYGVHHRRSCGSRWAQSALYKRKQWALELLIVVTNTYPNFCIRAQLTINDFLGIFFGLIPFFCFGFLVPSFSAFLCFFASPLSPAGLLLCFSAFSCVFLCFFSALLSAFPCFSAYLFRFSLLFFCFSYCNCN